jgi:hypothetical protein
MPVYPTIVALTSSLGGAEYLNFGPEGVIILEADCLTAGVGIFLRGKASSMTSNSRFPRKPVRMGGGGAVFS